MSAKPAPIPLLPQFEKGGLVRVRPVVSNRHRGEVGVVMHAKLDQHGVRVLDKYIVQFADNDQEEFWGIQLESEAERIDWTDLR